MFYVGSNFRVQVPVSGELFLGFNDSLYGDNSGAFRAVISRG
jgi:hypothetical protein